jgi:hypothetical protein
MRGSHELDAPAAAQRDPYRTKAARMRPSPRNLRNTETGLGTVRACRFSPISRRAIRRRSVSGRSIRAQLTSTDDGGPRRAQVAYGLTGVSTSVSIERSCAPDRLYLRAMGGRDSRNHNPRVGGSSPSSGTSSGIAQTAPARHADTGKDSYPMAVVSIFVSTSCRPAPLPASKTMRARAELRAMRREGPGRLL